MLRPGTLATRRPVNVSVVYRNEEKPGNLNGKSYTARAQVDEQLHGCWESAWIRLQFAALADAFVIIRRALIIERKRAVGRRATETGRRLHALAVASNSEHLCRK